MVGGRVFALTPAQPSHVLNKHLLRGGGIFYERGAPYSTNTLLGGGGGSYERGTPVRNPLTNAARSR